MKIHIVAGGPTDHLPLMTEHYEDSGIIWVGVDRGLYHLLQDRIVPKKAFGDFDSVSEEELEWMRSFGLDFDIHPCEKDKTDLEIALDWALQQRPEEIKLFGATGGRLDHALANIQLLSRGLDEGIPIVLIDHQNKIEMASPGTYRLDKEAEYRYVSFLAFSKEVIGIHLQGFKYPLENQTITWGSTLCISNEITKKYGTFSFSTGILLIIKSKD